MEACKGNELEGVSHGTQFFLETGYGIESAEAFYGHAVKDAAGLCDALHITQAEMDRLVRLVEGYLAPDYVERCRRPDVRHQRGVILE